MSTHRWYTIQTQTGHENKVRMLIQRKIDADPAEPQERVIRQVAVPTEEVMELRAGKKVVVNRKLYPGYVLVEMIPTEDAIHAVHYVQGVIRFVGKDNLPMPLQQEEVDRLFHAPVEPDKPLKVEIKYKVRQAVHIIDGPFKDFHGSVEEIMADKGKVRVTVSMFGRPTSVELDYEQVEAVA